MAETGLRVALLGAESTGKTALSLALGQALNDCGIACTVVPEYLREWCEREARTLAPKNKLPLPRNKPGASRRPPAKPRWCWPTPPP